MAAPTQETTKTASPNGTGGFLHPERTVASLDIRPGMRVADFGCGAGFFTMPTAHLVGGNGKVYAIDVQKHAIDLVKSKANHAHLGQVETIWADLELKHGSHLPQDSLDVVLIGNALFQAEKKKNIVAEAARIVRPDGRVVIMEWDNVDFPGGPPLATRVPKKEAEELGRSAGLKLEGEFEAGSHHYGLIFRK